MSCGLNFPALFRRAAEFVGKILRGTKPRELPVEQPTKSDLVINRARAWPNVSAEAAWCR